MLIVKNEYGSFSVSSIIRRKSGFFIPGQANSSQSVSHSEFDRAKKQRYDAWSRQIRGMRFRCCEQRKTEKLKCRALINAPINCGEFINFTCPTTSSKMRQNFCAFPEPFSLISFSWNFSILSKALMASSMSVNTQFGLTFNAFWTSSASPYKNMLD